MKLHFGAGRTEGSMARSLMLERYFTAVIEEGIYPEPTNLEFQLGFLFNAVPLPGKSVLDIGGGAGTYSFYASCAGAQRVVCLEPQAAGSSPGAAGTFRRMAARPGMSRVHLESTSFQDFDARGETFDVILLHDSINHLDEAACVALRHDATARARYDAMFRKMALLSMCRRAIASNPM